jgi:uncharacterized protein (DUF2147 family)
MRKPPIRIVVALAGLTAAGALLSVPAPGEVARQPAANPVGLWYAEGGAAQIEVRDCNGALCGRVVWLRSPFDEHGCELRDRHNPADSMRQRPVIGLEILSGLERSSSAEGVWTAGTLYDPGSGNTYRASLTVAGENRLELRGYVGIPLLGRTATWIRVGSEHAMCIDATTIRTESP